jgi:hypothetical protein
MLDGCPVDIRTESYPNRRSGDVACSTAAHARARQQRRRLPAPSGALDRRRRTNVLHHMGVRLRSVDVVARERMPGSVVGGHARRTPPTTSAAIDCAAQGVGRPSRRSKHGDSRRRSREQRRQPSSAGASHPAVGGTSTRGVRSPSGSACRCTARASTVATRSGVLIVEQAELDIAPAPSERPGRPFRSGARRPGVRCRR